MPTNTSFGPLGVPFDTHDTISMSVDEYEAIRLIDLEGCTQEECATQMHVARTTVQGIYESARKKLAQSLVNGKALYIEGGEYRLCDGQDVGCRRGGCCRYRFAQLLQDDQKKSE